MQCAHITWDANTLHTYVLSVDADALYLPVGWRRGRLPTLTTDICTAFATPRRPFFAFALEREAATRTYHRCHFFRENAKQESFQRFPEKFASI